MDSHTAAMPGAGKNRRVAHWVMVGAFFVVFATGLIFFVDALSPLAARGVTRYAHRVAAVVLVGTPIVYAVMHPRAAKLWLREAMFWRKGPAPVGVGRTWKRIHKSLVAGGLLLIVITGGISWFLKGSISSGTFQAVVTVHDIVFIAAACVVLYHIYYEFDWWMWKRKFCRDCAALSCADVCPNAVMVRTEGGSIETHIERCNSCRLCMQACRRFSYYRKPTSQTVQSVEPGAPAEQNVPG